MGKGRFGERLDVFIKEFRHLHRISLANDRIANFLGLYADENQLLIFTEYLPNGSVKDKILNNNINENNALHYFIDALKALNYLHTLEPPVIHRDIKAANLLLTISDSIKLANFGLVRDLAVDGFGIAVASDISLDFRGTLLYVAPEILTSELGPGNRRAYGKPADVWALGCTLIEMLTKYPPHFEYFGEVEGIQKEILDRASGDSSNADDVTPQASKVFGGLTEPDSALIKGTLPTYTPLETLENGIMGKSVLYVISFLVLGIGTLAFFLFISFCIVVWFRYLIRLSCECDLWQPQYIIISGILLILLFALMFSCCMVALGEYKFRIANKTIRESRFFVRRPQHDLVLCGVTILHARKDTTENDDRDEDMAHSVPTIPSALENNAVDQNFYYN
ncbi:unnamed protein product [Nippostrongylus brasiliensis]|uniref:Serine/threonine-protein kinase flr-4 (inferred by orthology to a C. elegans protein) n=1 Tax=Nippostrongylus brasiliensis TaxID=27835 RepID=A0A158R1D9_NIPBR|nr:unnamed protein product [Nippostrongylus brasiliensis]